MNYSKIFIRGVDTIGTFVLATPFYREVRRNFPDSKITVCVKPLVYELIKNCPYVDDIIIYNSKTLLERYKFIKKLKKDSYDLAFILSGSFHSALLCYLAGIKIRVGYPHDHRRFFLNHIVEENNKKHCVEYLLHIIESFGGRIENNNLELWFPSDKLEICDKIYNENKIKQSDIVIGIGFGVSGEKSRQWLTDNWVKLIRLLLEKENFWVILFGTKNDIEESNQIEEKVNSRRLINLTGKTNLSEFAYCVKKCSVYVSVATGGIHIASALNIKVLGLYCPGDEITWGPRGKSVEIITKYTNCAPCNQHKMRHCKNNICMKNIKVDEVYQKIFDVIQKNV